MRQMPGALSTNGCGRPLLPRHGHAPAQQNWKELHFMTGGAGGRLAGSLQHLRRACFGRKTTTLASAPAARGILHIGFPSHIEPKRPHGLMTRSQISDLTAPRSHGVRRPARCGQRFCKRCHLQRIYRPGCRGSRSPSTLESTFSPDKRSQLAPGDTTVGTRPPWARDSLGVEPRLCKLEVVRADPSRGLNGEYSLLFPWLNYLEVGATRLIGYWGAMEQKSSIRVQFSEHIVSFS
jgi:hypothetical protein